MYYLLQIIILPSRWENNVDAYAPGRPRYSGKLNLSPASPPNGVPVPGLHPAPTEMAASLRVPRKLCSFFFYVFLTFLTLVPQVILGFITYSREELLNIRLASTHHQYDQEYDFREADPVFCLSTRTTEWIPAGDPKKRLRKRGKWGGLLVRLRRRAHRAPLPSILLANVQSLDNKVDEIRARVAFQRDIRERWVTMLRGWLLTCAERPWFAPRSGRGLPETFDPS